MKLSDVYIDIHHKIELKERRARISQREMANRIGCSLDAYGGHLRGLNEPASVKHFLSLLNMLDDEDIVEVVKQYKAEKD